MINTDLHQMTEQRREARGAILASRLPSAVPMLALALVWSIQLALPSAVLAHGGQIRWDGDPAHLLEDLAVEFGLPLIILLGGAAAGVGLSIWLSRRQEGEARQDELMGDDEAAGGVS